MAKSLEQIQKQIEALQAKAQALKAKEMVGVVARIRDAIKHYALTPAELFGGATRAAASGVAKKTRKVRRRKGAAKKPAGPVKFRDEAGNTWGGIGKRPNWFKQALASGKTQEDLLAK